MEERFSVAAWPVANAAALDAIEAFSRHLDGSHQLLAAGGALAGLMLRLRVKAYDLAWWRQRQATDPWDCGYALNEPTARAALARFAPRRATLVVAVDWPEEALLETVRALHRAAPGFAHPVRWLIVQSSPGPAAESLNLLGVPVTVFQPRATAA